MARLIVRKRFPWKITILLTLAYAGVVVLGITLFIHLQQRPPLPEAVWKQVTFPVFLPQQGVALDTGSYKFDPGQKILSFTGKMSDGQRVTFAEQATPAPFTDIPDYYAQFLQTLFEYQSFDGVQGTIHLTHPKGAGQAAVLSSKGTLVFAHVPQDETEDVWRQVFNGMVVYQP